MTRFFSLYGPPPCIFRLSYAIVMSKMVVDFRLDARFCSSQKAVKEFFQGRGELRELFAQFSIEDQALFHTLISLGQGERVFPKGAVITRALLESLATVLRGIEQFYSDIGGIRGYHETCLRLVHEKGEQRMRGTYHAPAGIDIEGDSSLVRKAILSGLERIDQMCELYPLGGAADRLGLKDKKTGAEQTAASMLFCKRTLLQRLIDDVQAREFLAYRLFGKEVRIPIVIMTSHEKGNDADVRALFEENHWFGRDESDFFLMTQPLVPTMTLKGEWCVTSPACLFLKPGGHGVLWKLASDRGALDWLKEKGATKGLTRQINNVIAGIDGGLLAFTGFGLMEDRDFGFASCPKAKGASEGLNVIVETGDSISLTNIEYCDFASSAIDEEKPFLANTNLLFADLDLMKSLSQEYPPPGLLVNAKPIAYRSGDGNEKTEELLRLESTMQNIADWITEPKENIEGMKRSYITKNKREKTISTIKKGGKGFAATSQTAERCFYDLQVNARDLLTKHCNWTLPTGGDVPFVFFYHPALGPLYSIIGQKLKVGRMESGAEISLFVADLFAQNLSVSGSFRVEANALMGAPEKTGKCFLENVTVKNKGINHEATESYWGAEAIRFESCAITIEEGGEFYAKDVALDGNLAIHVPTNTKMHATMLDGKLHLHEEKLSGPTWHWDYSVGSDDSILLQFAGPKKRAQKL